MTLKRSFEKNKNVVLPPLSILKEFLCTTSQSSMKKVKIGELIDTLADPESSNEDIQHKSLEEIPG